MAKRIAISTLNASTIDILNTIRANASFEYQQAVPVVETESDIPRVGEVLYGYPALANIFINALVNRIASVRVKSATFNNAYAELKKGFLEYGETVEEAFVNIAKAREFNVEKAQSREFKRTLPDVRTAFHAMNWRVQYPVTIQDEDLRTAFLSPEGVTDLIAKIVNSVTVGAEYDEFLLFKYLMIKAIAKGKMYPVSIGDGTMEQAATKFRGMSNKITFMKTQYNISGVTTNTTKDDQYIFMDAEFNAQYDVEVLARAFNMDKADFMGRLQLIDDWTTFDNERFDEIRKNSTMIEEVTEDELSLMGNVKAVLVDKEWFQVYDNHQKFTEKYVASGEYWNYFLNVWKTVSSSPFSNAIVFVSDDTDRSLPETLTLEITNKSISEEVTVLTVEYNNEGASVSPSELQFITPELAVAQGVGVHKYGAYMFPSTATAIPCQVMVGETMYGNANIEPTLNVGSTIELTKIEELV